VTRTHNTITATFAALMIGALTMNPASAAANWSDISAVTHGGVTSGAKIVGTDEFNRTDLSAVTHGSRTTGEKQIGRFSSDNYSPTDITSITHN